MFSILPAAIHQKCIEILGTGIASVQPVGGGSISQTYLLETANGHFFIKINSEKNAARMFGTEARGLNVLAATGVVRTPEVIQHGELDGCAYLLMEYIEPGHRERGFWEKFGRSMAALHQNTAPQFGFAHSNFIGSMFQTNSRLDNWAEFYIQERLEPQVLMAMLNKKLTHSDFKHIEKLYQELPNLCPDEPPALVHGDLWSGNFLVGQNNEPVLIDPSVSYSHREMDLAMSHLFGGFDRDFYRSYEEAFPLAPGFRERLPVFQLYYLLVHVNLFGGSYVRSVREVIKRY
ncbi:MAG TPA: hypothetical protein ENJ95_11105 [Bacteroidetes bacterium]|nr:hypothetical protein [Bacteroidota bacterium]